MPSHTLKPLQEWSHKIENTPRRISKCLRVEAAITTPAVTAQAQVRAVVTLVICAAVLYVAIAAVRLWAATALDAYNDCRQE